MQNNQEFWEHQVIEDDIFNQWGYPNMPYPGEEWQLVAVIPVPVSSKLLFYFKRLKS